MERMVLVSSEAVAGEGEDSHTLRTAEQGDLFAAFDGCGGMGSKRYLGGDSKTGAYLAARLAAQCIGEWYGREKERFPENEEQVDRLIRGLEKELKTRFVAYRDELLTQERSTLRIVGSMQKNLPTTMCAVWTHIQPDGRIDCLFIWVGDTRGYVLTPKGLIQITTDDVNDRYDALENLYHDAPLQNVINADVPFQLHRRLISVKPPFLAMAATDGAFGYLPTPMEFEHLLLHSLSSIKTQSNWQKKLERELTKTTADDCTLLMAIYGYDSFEQMQDDFDNRHHELQAAEVTPVRRRRQNLDYARTRWQEYQKGYDLLERENHGDIIWRL